MSLDNRCTRELESVLLGKCPACAERLVRKGETVLCSSCEEAYVTGPFWVQRLDAQDRPQR